MTYINELEGEQRAYIEEAERLQEMIEHVESQSRGIQGQNIEIIKENVKEQEKGINNAKKELEIMNKELREKEEEIEKYKKETMEKSAMNENMIKEQKKEIEKFQKRLEEMKKTKTESVSKGEIEKLKKSKEDAKNKVIEQEKKIEELKKDIMKIDDSKEDEIKLIKNKGNTKNTKNTKKTNEKSKKVSYPKEVVEKLAGIFKKQGISTTELKNKLFERIEIDEGVTVYELSRILKRQPCDLSQDEALRFAEYLIEKNHEISHTKLTGIMRERPLLDILEDLTSFIMDPQSGLDKSPEVIEGSASNKEILPEHETPIDEEKAIQIFQKCFVKICKKLRQSNKMLEEIFEEVTITKNIGDEKAAMISPEDFIKVLGEKLDLKFDSIESTCLTKVLATSEEDDYIKLDDIIQIMRDFKEDSERQDEHGDNEDIDLNFNDLDEISLVLLFALTEYITSSKVALYNLFGDYIYQQDVEVDDQPLKIELINSEDFFDVMAKIGIGMDEKEHENLKEFLCIDQEYSDKLMVKKVKKAIEEFAVNDKLRSKAYGYYKELAENIESEGDNINDKQSNKSL